MNTQRSSRSGIVSTYHLLRYVSTYAVIVFTACLAVAHAAERQQWVGSWASALYGQTNQQQAPDLANVTFRQIVHLTLPGNALRIHFSNEFGAEPLIIAGAHVAISAGQDTIRPDTDREVRFGGKLSITIPPGSTALSDPIPLSTPAFADLAISSYFPAQQISVATFHAGANQTNYLQKGNVVHAAAFTSPVALRSWYFLKAVDVQPDSDGACAIVTLGDSITDGAFATINENRRWPDVLARRLQADTGTRNLSVLNVGIGANRVLHDGTGPSALARFDRDVLFQSGAKYVILLEGINDIGRLARNNDPGDEVSAEDLQSALQQMAARAHEHNIKVFAATITPYKGAGYFSEKGEAIRQAVNRWIRTSDIFDGVVDFEKATQDPANPQMLLPQYDCRDHLHPNDSGYKAMGDAIDLSLFH